MPNSLKPKYKHKIQIIFLYAPDSGFNHSKEKYRTILPTFPKMVISITFQQHLKNNEYLMQMKLNHYQNIRMEIQDRV